MKTLTPHDLNYCRKFIHEQAGIRLDERKDYLFESRLSVVLKEFGFDSMSELVTSLQEPKSTPLRQRVIDAMTTNESSFFRDEHPFEALQKFVLPTLMEARQSKRELSIWCAACSTGQEPYSLAVMLRDAVPELANWRVRILATDLSNRVLAKARAGIYTDVEARRGMPDNLRERYFEPHGGDWRVSDQVREMVEFREFNLINPWPALPTMDIAFLRNVLIYFDVETKTSVLGKMRNVLAPDGLLCLGAAETVLGIRQDYRPARLGRATFYRPTCEPKTEC